MRNLSRVAGSDEFSSSHVCTVSHTPSWMSYIQVPSTESMSTYATRFTSTSDVRAFTHVSIANSVQNSRLLSASQYMSKVHSLPSSVVCASAASGAATDALGTAKAITTTMQNKSLPCLRLIPPTPWLRPDPDCHAAL